MEKWNEAVPEALEAGWLRALAERYRGYADEAVRGGAADAAALLQSVAGELEAEVRRLGAPPVEIRLPDTEPEPPPHRMQAHDVWQLAVGDRERLFEALSARAGRASSAAVRQAAEVRARAQLDHIARGRLERRRAGRARPATRPPAIHRLRDLEAFHAAAEAQIERSEAAALATALIEDHLDALLDIAEQTSDHATQTRAQTLAQAQLNRLRRRREGGTPPDSR